MKRKNRGRHERYKIRNHNIVLNYNYYGCGERRHVKLECTCQKENEDKKGKKFMKKKAYIG